MGYSASAATQTGASPRIRRGAFPGTVKVLLSLIPLLVFLIAPVVRPPVAATPMDPAPRSDAAYNTYDHSFN